MAVTLEQKQGLIAGDGLLPVKMAQHAKENGFDGIEIVDGMHENCSDIELARKVTDIAENKKTIYVQGCFGAPMNAKNKERYTKADPKRAAEIMAADAAR